MKGGFISIGLNSTFYSLNNKFDGGRADFGGCVAI